jgi:hypothetical protein
MKVICASDYVLYDRANDHVVQFGDGSVIIYNDVQEAIEDCYGNESVVSCIDLPCHWKDYITTQINKN